jgi:hypothetical protein
VLLFIEYHDPLLFPDPSSIPGRPKAPTPLRVPHKSRLLDSDNSDATFNTALGPMIITRDTEELLPFEEAVKYAFNNDTEYMISFTANIPYAADIYKKLSPPEKDYGLTFDEFRSIYYYTVESLKLYTLLNRDLCSPTRDKNAPKWKHYLHYLFNALRKIPPWKSTQDLYRGVNQNLVKNNPKKYVNGAEITFYGFTSTSTKLERVKDFMGKSGEIEGTIFSINQCFSGRLINTFSGFPDENEVLIPAGSRFKIEGILELVENITLIQLKQIPTLEISLKME